MGSWLVSLLRDWKDRFTPYKDWIGELKSPEVLKADAMAGLTVALVLIPQSMAYAQLAGLPAQVGLYASFLPVMVAAIFGSSRQLGTGPVAIVSIMSAAAMQPFAAQGLPIETIVIYSAMLALMIGIFQLSLGLLRMGVLVDFLSHPVVVGFTNAGALIIATSQVPKLFGLNVKPDQFEHSYQFWWATITSLGDTKPTTLALGAFALATLIVLKKYAPRLPGC